MRIANAWAQLDRSKTLPNGKHPIHHAARGLTTPIIALTFLTPATQCNQFCFDCPITAINGEPTTGDATAEDYLAFINAYLYSGLLVHNVSVQGYEPTLAHAWQYAAAILDKSRYLIPPVANAEAYTPLTGMVTNGMRLAEYAEEIVRLKVDSIGISLDGLGQEHDYWRRRAGAFDIVLEQLGLFLRTIKSLAKSHNYKPHINIMTVLRGQETLKDMPRRLKQMGIFYWTVSPAIYLDPKGAVSLKYSAEDNVKWIKEIFPIARRYGINLKMIDEFGTLKQYYSHLPRPHFIAKNLPDINQLVRFNPNRTYAMGLNTLKPYGDPTRETYLWDRAEGIALQEGESAPKGTPYFLLDHGYKLPWLREAWDQAVKIQDLQTQLGIPIERDITASRLIPDITSYKPTRPALNIKGVDFPGENPDEGYQVGGSGISLLDLARENNDLEPQ